MKDFFNRLVVPGLVIQAVMVGGGYATGRELVEFFVSKGPATGLLGLGITAAIFSAGTMIAFELARRFQAFDYQTLNRVYLGRFAILFELGYFCTLLLSLSVVSAAAARLVGDALGTPELVNSITFVLLVAALVFFGNRMIEKVISWWSILFYLTYGLMFVMVLSRYSGQLGQALAAAPVDVLTAGREALSFTGYNIVILPILIFVARNFRSRREALIAGALAGPLILLPGLAFILALSAFYPGIVDAALPVSVVLEGLSAPWLSVIVQLVIIGALIKTGAGMLHGLNERLARRYEDLGRTMPRLLRPGVALGAMAIAVVVADKFGLIDLIGKGYRYSGIYFTVIFLIPLLTHGLWLVLRPEKPAAAGGHRVAPATPPAQ